MGGLKDAIAAAVLRYRRLWDGIHTLFRLDPDVIHTMVGQVARASRLTIEITNSDQRKQLLKCLSVYWPILLHVHFYDYSPIHTADADETKLSSLVASAVCTRIRN